MFLRKLNLGIRKITGRSSLGRLTIFHRGAGVKKKFRLIDFSRIFYYVPATVILVNEYDPNRSAFISLVCYENGILSYILSASGFSKGDTIISMSDSLSRRPHIGDHFQLRYFPIGSLVFSVGLYGGVKGRLARAAGTSCLVLKKFVDKGYVLLKLPSGTHYLVRSTSFATNGRVSNPGHKFFRFFKAGSRRRLGFRPVVRGVAMNPVDHPHGGGEGKAAGGRPSVTPWGFVTKGPKTRSLRKKLSFIVVSRNVNKKGRARFKKKN